MFTTKFNWFNSGVNLDFNVNFGLKPGFKLYFGVISGLKWKLCATHSFQFQPRIWCESLVLTIRCSTYFPSR